MNSIFSLQDKNIWVLGGAGYLGQAVVHTLYQQRATILCLDIGSKPQEFVNAQAFAAQVKGETFDVSQIDEIDQQLDKLLALYGVPDGIVNLVFGSTAHKLEDLSYLDFDKANQMNLTSTFAISRKLATAMSEKGSGAIVLFSSMYGLGSPYPEVYEPNLVKNPIEYGVGKAGVIQMTKYLAVHYGKQGVRCNCVSPGPFPNPIVQQSQPEFIAKLEQRSPMGRIGKSEEIAGAVAFLLADASTYVNGHNLVVDGGWTSW